MYLSFCEFSKYQSYKYDSREICYTHQLIELKHFLMFCLCLSQSFLYLFSPPDNPILRFRMVLKSVQGGRKWDGVSLFWDPSISCADSKELVDCEEKKPFSFSLLLAVKSIGIGQMDNTVKIQKVNIDCGYPWNSGRLFWSESKPSPLCLFLICLLIVGQSIEKGKRRAIKERLNWEWIAQCPPSLPSSPSPPPYSHHGQTVTKYIHSMHLVGW